MTLEDQAKPLHRTCYDCFSQDGETFDVCHFTCRNCGRSGPAGLYPADTAKVFFDITAARGSMI